MDRVLIDLYVPAIEMKYNVWIPLNKEIYAIISLIVKGIKEIKKDQYSPTQLPNLYDKQTGEKYDVNSKVKDTSIRNGSEIILI